MISTSKTVKSERELRRAAADRADKWRKDHSGRPEPRILDRVAVEAFMAVLGTPGIIKKDIATEIMRLVSDASLEGLQRLGYDKDEARVALATRLRIHVTGGRSAAVRPALRERRAREEAEAREKARTT